MVNKNSVKNIIEKLKETLISYLEMQYHIKALQGLEPNMILGINLFLFFS